MLLKTPLSLPHHAAKENYQIETENEGRETTCMSEWERECAYNTTCVSVTLRLACVVERERGGA